MKASDKDKKAALKEALALLSDENGEFNDAYQDDLDMLVHDEMSHQASDINNQGYDKQVEFLIERWGPKALLKLLKEDWELPEQ